MCGRYASSKRPEDLIDEFDVVESRVEVPLAADYNVAPTKDAYVVMDRPVDDVAARHLSVARWGLVPSWAKDPSIGSRLINARSETLAEKPAFRKAYASRRCLVPADGYYEWYVTDTLTRAGKPVKQPFYIRPEGDGSLPMAGLYEWWRNPAATEDDPARWMLSCTVITTTAADELGRVHDRMPLVVRRDDWDAWLDPSAGEADALMVPATEYGLRAYPVATLVNNVRNNGPELIAPLPVHGQEGSP